MNDKPALFIASVSVISSVVTLYFMPRISGWSELAARYPSSVAAPAPLTRFGYACFRGWLGYKGVLVIAADDSGLYLAMNALMSWCHAPVFIPWSQVAGVRPRAVWWRRYCRVDLKSAPEIDFALREGDLRLVRPWLDKAGVPVVEAS